MTRNDLFCTAVIAAFALSMAAAPAAAKSGSGNAKVKPAVRAASAKPGATTKVRGSSASTGAKTKAQTPKVKATGATKAKASGSAKVSSKPTATNGTAPTAETRPNKSTDTRPNERKSTDTRPNEPKPTDIDPAGTAVPLNKAQQLLTKNTNLRLKLALRLPAGTDVIGAASGFRNLGQFVAAVNVSYNNPGVSFLSLKTLMTGDPPMSLGRALQQLRGLDPATASTTASTAVSQANADIAAASPTVAKKTKTKKS